MSGDTYETERLGGGKFILLLCNAVGMGNTPRLHRCAVIAYN